MPRRRAGGRGAARACPARAAGPIAPGGRVRGNWIGWRKLNRHSQPVGAVGHQARTDLAAHVAGYIHHDHVHHNFRLRLIEIMQQLFHQRHFIHGVAHHDGILSVELEHAANVRHGSHGRYYFRKFLRRGRVLQVEDLHHFVFIIAALSDVVFGNEDRVGAHRLPKCLGQQPDVIQRLLQCHVVQIQVGVLARLHLRIEQHIDSRQLPHRLIKHSGRLIVHFEQADLVGYRLQLGYRLERSDHLETFFLRFLV